MKEIRAEASLADRAVHVARRRRDDARADRDRHVRAEALDLLLFDEAQQLALRFHRQFVDAIEIERALAGKLEASRTRHRGVGEGAELLTEKLRLDQRGRQHRAVHDDERLAPPDAEIVEQADDEILADAGLAGDEHVRVGPRVALQRRRQRAHERAARDQRRQPGCYARW